MIAENRFLKRAKSGSKRQSCVLRTPEKGEDVSEFSLRDTNADSGVPLAPALSGLAAEFVRYPCRSGSGKTVRCEFQRGGFASRDIAPCCLVGDGRCLNVVCIAALRANNVR